MREVHKCQCQNCVGETNHPNQILHHQMNIFLSRLNEQERRWFVALESKKLGHGGDTHMSLITGLHPETIRKGRRELDADLENRPEERVRLPGAGRPPLKKTTRRLKTI